MSTACEVTLIDPASGPCLPVSFRLESAQPTTVRDFFDLYRSANSEALAEADRIVPGDRLEAARLVDSLFLLQHDGSIGHLHPGLRFFRQGEPCDFGALLTPEERVTLTVDRSHCGYDRNWPAYLRRRWDLQRLVYEQFVKSVLTEAYGRLAESVLTLDTPGKRWKFVEAIAARVHSAPFETYSRYQQPHVPFRSCDRALDSIIAGDGGVCAEKAMAFYFIVNAYGVPVELVLGGEDAEGEFPYRELRTLLNQSRFDFHGSEEVQRYWEHFAVLCQIGPKPEEYALCDVANSNIPLLVWSRRTAQPYLAVKNKKPLHVRLTAEDLRLYYHRIPSHQDLPLDLFYAMEYFIDFVDLIQTIDNELGLIISEDFWVGVITYSSRREREQIIRSYRQTILQAGRSPDHELCFTPRLSESSHILVHRFRSVHERIFKKIESLHNCLRSRVDDANGEKKYNIEYVLLDLHPYTASRPSQL